MPAKKTAKADSFTDAERAAMKERAAELKAAKSNTEPAVLAKIAELPEPDRTLGERIHALVRAAAPGLTPKLWYGMPAYARDGKVVCFFQPGSKFETRYSTFSFNDAANLDDGDFWPVGFGITAITPAVEERITALVKQAVS